MGGTVDPKTGKVVWEFHVPLDEQRLHYAAHPPSSLRGLNVRAIELPDHQFDGHGEPVNAIFDVACPCGGTEFYASAYFGEGERPGPPFTIECAECGNDYCVFDAAVHGYDGAVGNNRGVVLEDDSPQDVEWDDFESPYRVVVRFEYPSEHLGDPEWAGREPELFSWITVLGQNASGATRTLLDYECA